MKKCKTLKKRNKENFKIEKDIVLFNYLDRNKFSIGDYTS